MGRERHVPWMVQLGTQWRVAPWQGTSTFKTSVSVGRSESAAMSRMRVALPWLPSALSVSLWHIRHSRHPVEDLTDHRALTAVRLYQFVSAANTSLPCKGQSSGCLRVMATAVL